MDRMYLKGTLPAAEAGAGVDLSALKESIKCMKIDAYGDSDSFVTIGASNDANGPNDDTVLDDDAEFLGAEARGRCYTWPVAANKHQPLQFTVLSSHSDLAEESPSLTASMDGSSASLAYAGAGAGNPTTMPPLSLISGSGPIYAVNASQPDTNCAEEQFSYYRAMCNSSPTFGGPPPSDCLLPSSYFSSEASCSYASEMPLLPAGYNYTTMMTPDFAGDAVAAAAKLRRRQATKKFDGGPVDKFGPVIFATPTTCAPSSASSGVGSSIASSSTATLSSPAVATAGAAAAAALSGTTPQKKPNAWGSDSYAELIEKAILSSPGGRLKLNEIYDWFIDNIPYFCKKSSQDGAVGWKNSIRHNLSLHSRFMRIQNEGAGKSSWWVINPEAKPGRNPRRRAATLEAAAAKVIIDKKRRGAKRRLELSGGPPGAGGSPFCRAAGNLSGAGGGNTTLSSTTSLLQQDLYTDFGFADNFSQFRPRTQSVLSVTSSRMSPAPGPPEPPGFEDFKFPFPEPEPTTAAGGTATSNGPVTELLNRTDQIRLDPGSQSAATTAAVVHANVNGTKMESQPTTQAQTHQNAFISTQTAPQAVEVKTEMADNVPNSAQDDAGVAQPPSYQELNAVRPGVQISQNPLLRSNQLQRGNVPAPAMKSEPNGFGYFSSNMMFLSNQTPPTMNFSTPLHSAPWPPPPPQAAGLAASGANATSNSFLSSPALSQMAGAPPSLSTYLPYSSCAAGAFNAFPTTVSAGMGLVGRNGIADGLIGAAALAGNTSAAGNMVHLPMDLQNLSMNHSMMEVDVDELLRYDLRMDAQQQGAAGQGPYRFDLP